MKKASLIAFIVAGTFISCSDQTTVYSDPHDDVLLEGNQSLLDNSIKFDNAGVLDIFEEDKTTAKFSKNMPEGQAGDYPLTLVAQVSPPTYNGTLLTASHVDVDGDFAYVAYNTSGDTYLGAIDIVNVSDPNNPQVTARLYYENADINSIKYDNGFVYAVGGLDAEKSLMATANSFVAKIISIAGTLNTTAGIEYVYQQGFNATDVKVSGNNLIVTSGKDGTVTIYDKTSLAILQEAPFTDLRSIALQDNVIAVLDGSKGVSLLDQTLQLTKDIPIVSDFGIYAKRTIDFYQDKIIVSEGTKGAGVYDVNTGNLLEYVPILIDPAGVESTDKVTNAVANNEGVLLMANGGAGLCLSEESANNTKLVGIIQLEGSINFVASKGDYVFAASGKSGLQIIKMNKPTASLAALCATSPIYSGSSNLVVAVGEDMAFSGSKRFNNVDIEGTILLCGSWTVKEAVNINGLLEMNGTFVVANNSKKRNVTLGKNATLRVEGNLTIYGDLILNDGATLEFIGPGSVVNIFGSVISNGATTITGTFQDVQNKF